MEQKRMENTVMPALSSKYPWFVAQNLKNEGDDDTQAHIFYNLHDPLCHYHCKVQELLGKRIKGVSMAVGCFSRPTIRLMSCGLFGTHLHLTSLIFLL